MKIFSRYNHKALCRPVIILFILAALSGCATGGVPATAASAGSFADILESYAPTGEPLKIRELPVSSPGIASAADVYIIVHPGYGVFFQNLTREKHEASKYLLLNKQFENEASFISSRAASGATIILVLPRDFETEGLSPPSFISYLNKTAGGPSVFYMTSKSSGSGNIATDDMINLVAFLQSVKAERIMIGGGYIGRCQGEFYSELTTYLGAKNAYIVPEISTISPADISDQDASAAFEAMRHQNYTLVRRFIGKKAGNATANILSIRPPSNN